MIKGPIGIPTSKLCLIHWQQCDSCKIFFENQLLPTLKCPGFLFSFIHSIKYVPCTDMSLCAQGHELCLLGDPKLSLKDCDHMAVSLPYLRELFKALCLSLS